MRIEISTTSRSSVQGKKERSSCYPFFDRLVGIFYKLLIIFIAFAVYDDDYWQMGIFYWM